MRLRAMLAVLVTLSAPPASGLHDGERGEARPPVIVSDATSPGWARQVEWGLERFRTAGLPLPAVTIEVHDDDAPCDGNAGLYRSGEPPEIHLCSSAAPDSRAARLITLHELAHAWAETQLVGERRAALLELRGLQAWEDRRIPPHEWGAEHAAEIVSWGLMDEPVRIIRIYDAEPSALSPAFELLVGRSPLWSPVGDRAGAPG